MHRKNFSIVLVVLLAILLIITVILIFDRRIKNIDKKTKSSAYSEKVN